MKTPEEIREIIRTMHDQSARRADNNAQAKDYANALRNTEQANMAFAILLQCFGPKGVEGLEK